MTIEPADLTFTRGLEYLRASARLQAMTDIDDTTREALQRLSNEYRRRAMTMMGTASWGSDVSPAPAHQHGTLGGRWSR